MSNSKTVKEAIENVKTQEYLVTKDGKILMLNGKIGNPSTNETELLNSMVKKVETIPGVKSDVTAIRI